MTEITITAKEYKDGRWSITGSDGKKYSFWEKKQNGETTKAFEQFQKYQLGIGTVVQAEVKENPYKDKNKVDRIALNILYFKSDEHGTPEMRNSPKPEQKTEPTLEKRVSDLEAIVRDLAKAVGVSTPAKTKEEFKASLNKDIEELSENLQNEAEEIRAEEVPF